MEEEKKLNPQQNENPAQNGGGRKRKRRHKRGKGGGNPNAQNNSQNNGQHQNAQAVAQPQAQAQGQKQSAQAQPQKQEKPQQKQEKHKEKNRPQNPAQNSQKQQNGGGRDKTNDKNERRDGNKKEDNRKDTYAYILDGNLYINLTNKCSNACDFCVRNERDSYYGNYLWIRHGDPTPEKVIAQIKGMGDITRFKEAVFCGFGEPTYKVSEMLELCDYFHEKGLSTRLNTNGQGNLINKRDIVPELKGKIDLVNVSLNASCVEKYQPICRSQFGENGFAAMIDFAKACKKNGVNCRFSIVDCIGKEEVEACKRLAASVNVPLYVRDYITDS